jgi:hypothetical protein
MGPSPLSSATHPEASAAASACTRESFRVRRPIWREAFVIALVIVAVGGLIVLAIKWQHTTVLLKRMAPRFRGAIAVWARWVRDSADPLHNV